MRILCVGRRLIGGGAERAQMNFLRAAGERKISLRVIYLKSGGELADETLKQTPVEFLTEPQQSLWPRVFRILWRLFVAAREADVVFAMQEGTPIYLAAIAARLAGKPCVGWNHGLPRQDVFFGWHKAVMPLLYRLTRRIICVTQSQRAEWEATTGTLGNRFCVVPVPIEIGQIRKSAGEELPPEAAWMTRTRIVLGLGRLRRLKRFDLLIRAASSLWTERRHFRVLILGSGEKLAQLERVTEEQGAAGYVVFLPFDPNPYRYIARCSVLVVPSLWESFGMVAIEALALGKVVVGTTSWKAFPEILGSEPDGLGIITEDTPEALAEGINAALNMPNNDEVVARRMRRAECFDTGVITDRILDVLRSVMNTAA